MIKKILIFGLIQLTVVWCADVSAARVSLKAAAGTTATPPPTLTATTFTTDSSGNTVASTQIVLSDGTTVVSNSSTSTVPVNNSPTINPVLVGVPGVPTDTSGICKSGSVSAC